MCDKKRGKSPSFSVKSKNWFLTRGWNVKKKITFDFDFLFEWNYT